MKTEKIVKAIAQADRATLLAHPRIRGLIEAEVRAAVTMGRERIWIISQKDWPLRKFQIESTQSTDLPQPYRRKRPDLDDIKEAVFLFFPYWYRSTDPETAYRQFYADMAKGLPPRQAALIADLPTILNWLLRILHAAMYREDLQAELEHAVFTCRQQYGGKPQD